MGVQIEVKQQQSEMIRLVNGKLEKQTSAANIYVVPPKAEYHFMVTGYAVPFEMPKAQEYGGGTQTMTRIEFTITEGKGKGRMFTQLWGFSIGPKSNLGIFCRKMQIPMPDAGGSFDLDEMIGYTGTGYVTPSDTLGDDKQPKYARLSLDTVEGTGAPDKPYSYTGEIEAPRPSSNGHTNGHAAEADDDGWPAN